MRRVFITGMSGVGKSTVIGELAALGYPAVDTDYGGWTEGSRSPDQSGCGGRTASRPRR